MIRPLASGFVTSEFWMALAALAGKMVALYFVVHTISLTDPNSQNALASSVMMVVLGIGTVVGIAHGASNYSNNRTQLKMEAVRMGDVGPEKSP